MQETLVLHSTTVHEKAVSINLHDELLVNSMSCLSWPIRSLILSGHGCVINIIESEACPLGSSNEGLLLNTLHLATTGNSGESNTTVHLLVELDIGKQEFKEARVWWKSLGTFIDFQPRSFFGSTDTMVERGDVFR
jgi:hypothetical protein